MPSITLRHIEIFHAVMTAGNLTEAAGLLHTSQPTVSRELARLEKLIGLQLFERSRGRLHPTVQGLRLFEEVQRSWYGLDRILSAAESLREFRQGELSIACLPVFSQSFLPLQINVVLHGRDAPNLVSTLNIAAFNVGNALGAWVGGTVIAHGFGLTAVPVAAAGLAAIGLIICLINFSGGTGHHQPVTES